MTYEVKFPAREIWQEDVLQFYISNPNGKWIVVKSVRQIGKSTLAQLLLAYSSLQMPNSVSLSVSPVLSQSRKMFNDITVSFEGLIKKSNASLLEIEFVNGSTIKFKSAEQGDSIRGETVKHSGILVVDEAAYQNDQFFYSTLVPTTNVYNADIFIFSTPKFKQGFFFDLYCKGLGDEQKLKSFDWTKYDTSKYLDSDTLAIYRAQLPKTAFQSEYLGEFISGDGQVFTDFKHCIKNAELDFSKTIYITVDWSTGQGGNTDDTAITIGQVQNDKLVVTNIITYNDKRTQDNIQFIIDLINDCVTNGAKDISLLVEHNSIGQIYYDLLFEAVDKYEDQHNDIYWRTPIEINLRQFTTTNQSKKRIIEQLVNLFEKDLITIPKDEKLINQLSLFEAKIDNNNTVKYAGAMNSHDDCVMSLAFLGDCVYKDLI